MDSNEIEAVLKGTYKYTVVYEDDDGVQHEVTSAVIEEGDGEDIVVLR